MAIDDQLAALLAQNAGLFATYEEFSNGQTMLLAGTIDDPDSFNSQGGKTGALGYYPVVNVSGQTIYVPCMDRLKNAAIDGVSDALDAVSIVGDGLLRSSGSINEELTLDVAAASVEETIAGTRSDAAVVPAGLKAAMDLTSGSILAYTAAGLTQRVRVDEVQQLEETKKKIGRDNLGAIDRAVVDARAGIEMLGVGDGVADDTTLLRDTFAAITAGGRATGRIGARYRANNLLIEFGDDDITVDWNSASIRAPDGAYYDGLHIRGIMTKPMAVAIDTTSVPGKTLLSWPGGIPAGFKVGDWVKVVSDDLIPFRYGTTFSLRCGYSLCIQSFNGVTATCMGSPPYASAYVTNVRAARFPRGKVIVRDGSVLGDPNQPSAPTDPIPLNHHILIENAVFAEVMDITVGNGPAPGIIAYNCVHARISRPRGRVQADLLGGAVGSLNSFCTVIEGPISALTRHLGDASANSVPANQLGGDDVAGYGLDYYCTIRGGGADGSTTSAATFHEGAYQPRYEGIRIIHADKVFGIRGDMPTWANIVADNCGVVAQIVRRTNSLRIVDSMFRNIRGQAMVSNQVNGVDQTLAGTSEIARTLWHCNAVGFSRIFLPVIEEGALLILKGNTWKYDGSEGGKAILSPYGTGDFIVNDTIDLRDLPAGITGIVPMRLSSALRSVRGRLLILLRTASQASCLSAILQMDAISAAFVDLILDVQCADGSTPVLNPLINNSTNTEQVYLSTNCADGANYGLSTWVRRTGIGTNDGRLIHNSREPALRYEVLLTASVTGWTAAPGYKRGQRLILRNSASSNYLFVFYGIIIRPGREWEFVWDGATWSPAWVQISGTRTWTPGTGNVPAGATVNTVISVPLAFKGEPAAVMFKDANLPTGLVLQTASAPDPNAVTVFVTNPTAAAIATVNLTVTAEVIR